MSLIYNNEYEVLTLNGFQSFKGIKETLRKDNIKFTFCDRSYLIVTPEHKFLVSNKPKIFRKAYNIKVGHKVYCANSSKKVSNIKYNVSTSRDISKQNKFYDLIDVQGGNHYISNNVTSHNCAFIDTSKWEDFEDSVLPTLATSKTTQIIKISTPNGYNHFHKDWQEALNGTSGYVTFLVTWEDIDIYDKEWKEGELKRIGPIKFARNYSCVTGDTKIKVQIKDKVKDISIEDLHNIISTKDIKILTPSGYQKFDGVKRTKKSRKLLSISTKDKNIKVTPNHKLKSIDGFVEASCLSIGNEILTRDGVERITNIENYISSEYVYDALNVANGNEYYTNDMISHNCSFIGSSKTLLSPEMMTDLIKAEAQEDVIVEGDKLYKDYNPEAVYIISCDSSKTVGVENAENDYLAINVTEFLNGRMEQAYVFRCNDLHYKEVSKIIYKIGEYYNFPLCAVENNEGSGTYIANDLFDTLEYPNMYFDPSKNGEEVDIRSTKKNRPIAIACLKKLIESKIFKINHDFTIDEFSTFIKIGKKYTASAGSTDDLIMSLVICIYVLLDPNNDLEITIDDFIDGNDVKFMDKEEDNSSVCFYETTSKANKIIDTDNNIIWNN